MWTSAVTPELIANSVIAVPPLARDSHRKISVVENTKMIRAIEAGGDCSARVVGQTAHLGADRHRHRDNAVEHDPAAGTGDDAEAVRQADRALFTEPG